jgi:S1-C subfamily serine protease
MQAGSEWGDTYEAVKEGVVRINAGQGTGSGFIISKEGEILTNEHVVSGYTQVEVIFYDDAKYKCVAEVLNTSTDFDVALLHLSDCELALTVLPMAYGVPIKIGNEVMAVGNPFRLGRAATVGVVSNPRVKAGKQMYIQHDAAINPGNSGGPLFNKDGQVIGMNAAGIRDADGVGLAIPIRHAMNLVDTWRN